MHSIIIYLRRDTERCVYEYPYVTELAPKRKPNAEPKAVNPQRFLGVELSRE